MEIEFREGISEVIATTRNGQPNAAPMGIINRESLYVLVYKESHTYVNVTKNRELVANFVSDPTLYVKTAFEDLDSSFFRPDEKAPVLKAAHAWTEFECVIEERPTQKTAVIRLHATKSVVLQRPVVAFNRAFCAVLEATVHATRFKKFEDQKYLALIAQCERTVRKCGGTQEFEALKLLKQYLTKLTPNISRQ